MSFEDIFAWRDAFLAEHPEYVRAMKAVTWHEWAQRQQRPYRVIGQKWVNGELVYERDITPPDPEPPL